MREKIKLLYFITAVIILVFAQYFVFFKFEIGLAVLLNLTGLIIGILSFTSFPESTYGYFLKFISFLKSFLISIKKPERADVVSEGKNNAVNKDVNTGMKVYRHSGKKPDLKNIPADGPVMNITIPKIIFLILGIVLFLVVQLFLVKQNYRAVVFLLFADVLLLVSFFLIRETLYVLK